MTIQDAITYYKDNFEKCWNDEKYKWVAVEHFKNHWNIDAPDFAGMVSEAFRKATNLLSGYNYYAYAMLCNLAQQDPEKMRNLFQMLYNEELPLGDRLNTFWDRCAEALKVFKENHPDFKKAKNHYQDLRALCVYLSFRYPEKYYLFKDKMYKDFKVKIGFQETSTEEVGSIRRYDNFSRMCNDVLASINEDPELLEKQQKQLEMEPDCYGDESLHLLVQTIIYVNCGHEEEVIPSSAKYKRWIAPLVNALYELGGSATRPEAMDKVFSLCGVTENELAEKFKSGTSKIKNELDWAMLALYSEGMLCDRGRGVWALSDLGKRILISDDLAGRIVAKVNKIALARKNGEKEPEIDLTPYYQFRGEKHGPPEGGCNQIQEGNSPKLTGKKQFWWLNANPKIWSFSNLGIGESQSYTLYNENGNKRRIFQNFLDAKSGDMVIGYESTPVKQIVAIGRISGEQDGTQLFFEKVEGLETPIDYATLRECPELEEMEYFQNPQGSLFKLTKACK